MKDLLFGANFEVVLFENGKYGVRKHGSDSFFDLVSFGAPDDFQWPVGDKYFPDCQTRFYWRAARALKKLEQRYTQVAK